MAFSLHTCAQVVQLQTEKTRILTNAVGREWKEVAHCGTRTTFAFFLAVLNYSGSAHKSRKRAKNAREKGEGSLHLSLPHLFSSVTIKLQLKLLLALVCPFAHARKYATRFLFKYHSIFKSNPDAAQPARVCFVFSLFFCFLFSLYSSFFCVFVLHPLSTLVLCF